MADNFDMKQFLTENQIGPYAKNTVKENRTAKDLFQMFKDEDLVNDRRDYDEEDLMSAYSDLSSEEAGKLVNMLQNVSEESVRMFKSDNPEGDQLVLRFLKGIAQKFDYPVSQAALFVKERIKKLGY